MATRKDRAVQIRVGRDSKGEFMKASAKEKRARPTREELMAALSNPTVSVEMAAVAYGVGRNKAYEAVKSGQIKSIRMGGKIICPTAPIRKDLGLGEFASQAA